MPGIKPQIKKIKVTYELDEPLAGRIAAYAKSLDDSTPSHVVGAVMTKFLDAEERQQKPKPAAKKKAA